MSKEKNGGPAFPGFRLRHVEIRNGNTFPVQDPIKGMSLRDYFAAKASDGDIAEIMCRLENIEFDGCEKIFKITRQQARYIHADAMLAEREK